MIISSEWIYETGNWDGTINDFVTITFSEVFIKDIELIVYKDLTGKEIVRFLGGPTGFEYYRMEDLKLHDLDNDERFCICGGTINSWANCTVSCRDIHKTIKQYEGETL